MKILVLLLVIILSFALVVILPVTAQVEKASILFEEANKHFSKGEYREAIQIYDKILEVAPDNVSTLKMKGIAQSNLGYHEQSLKQFYKVIQRNPNDVISLVGMGVGFGYLGEYHEARKYFERAYTLRPDSIVINNYKEYADKVIKKYPYTPTEKPTLIKTKPTSIPLWIKNNARWWSDGGISNADFVSGIRYLIQNGIMVVDPPKTSTVSKEKIPDWVRSNAGWWAQGKINDNDFLSGIYFLIQNGIMLVQIEDGPEQLAKKRAEEFRIFERYVNEISRNVAKEKRYIEFPNPSFDVIKKFLRDYVKWNFEAEAKSAAETFPNPSYEIINGTYTIHYKVFVNEQPSGLPLDHVSTFDNSIEFWESQEFSVNNQKAKVEFSYTNSKSEANIWVTWVVRSLGEGVLGHAHLGKGIVEVALGDFSCDGSFQLYDVATVERIMTHELGHSIGLDHSTYPSNIMYPKMNPKYAYCLLS